MYLLLTSQIRCKGEPEHIAVDKTRHLHMGARVKNTTGVGRTKLRRQTEHIEAAEKVNPRFYADSKLTCC